MTIDRAFYLRQIDVWSLSQPKGTRLTPAEQEQLADHLYGNAAQLLVLEREAKDAAFEGLLDAAKYAYGYMQSKGAEAPLVRMAIEAAKEV